MIINNNARPCSGKSRAALLFYPLRFRLILASFIVQISPMRITLLATAILVLSFSRSGAQVNIISTNPVAHQVLLGNYDPSQYMPSVVINHPDSIVKGINQDISPDTLKSYLFALRTFQNRNTGSDTVSSTKGIGAARRWVYSKFQEYSAANQNRLIPSYLQFDRNICDVLQHRNIFAVLPGIDTTDNKIIIIEGHIDSRCEDVCDTACVAEGMEDNGSGTALVMELARVMSRYTFNHTIVFLVTIGEEQGLYGAEAFADYVQQNGIPVKGVLNNDVIGGVICGQTASPPGCQGFNTVDSTQVRLFSFGGYNSFHKGLARFVKLEYKEELLPLVSVPMTVSIMSPEDRTGRGGDHIPFRQHSYPAIRFTAANEHGDAGVTDTAYADRQHTSADVLGVDTDNDMVIDSFFVDFNYLARNAAVNGTAAGMMGIGPKQPDFLLTSPGQHQLSVQLTQQTQYGQYRIGVRTLTNDFDSVYTINSTSATINVPPATTYYVSVASVDTNGIESLFSREYMMTNTGVKEQMKEQGVQLLQNRPNPADESTIISVLVSEAKSYKEAYIRIADIKGKEVKRIALELMPGMNEVLYDHGYNVSGTFIYSLVIDGKVLQSKRMTFTN